MWSKGHTTPIWDDEYKKLNYQHQNAHPKDIEHWRRQGFIYEKFTGDMFAEQNKMPRWVHSIANTIGLTDCGFTFYKMKPGIVMPKHIDHFEKYCKIYNCNKKHVWRAIVALEDWQSGHYFEIDNNPILNYVAGDFILWSSEMAHMAANIGNSNRYTLQITGKKI